MHFHKIRSCHLRFRFIILIYLNTWAAQLGTRFVLPSNENGLVPKNHGVGNIMSPVQSHCVEKLQWGRSYGTRVPNWYESRTGPVRMLITCETVPHHQELMVVLILKQCSWVAKQFRQSPSVYVMNVGNNSVPRKEGRGSKYYRVNLKCMS